MSQSVGMFWVGKWAKMSEKYLVLFQAISAGQNDSDLGSDEEQCVYLLYAIHDVQQNKVNNSK